MALPVPEYGTENDVFESRNPAMSVEEAFDVFSAAAPDGWRVELIEGEIHVTPPANGEHEEIVSELSGQVRDHRKDLARYTGIGLFVPGASMTGRSCRTWWSRPRAALPTGRNTMIPPPYCSSRK